MLKLLIISEKILNRKSRVSTWSAEEDEDEDEDKALCKNRICNASNRINEIPEIFQAFGVGYVNYFHVFCELREWSTALLTWLFLI